MKPEDRNNEFHTLRLHENGRAMNRDDGWGGVKEPLTASIDYSPLTKEEQLELAVDLDNLEEKLRFASDGDADREMLQRWVDRLCK